MWLQMQGQLVVLAEVAAELLAEAPCKGAAQVVACRIVPMVVLMARHVSPATEVSVKTWSW